MICNLRRNIKNSPDFALKFTQSSHGVLSFLLHQFCLQIFLPTLIGFYRQIHRNLFFSTATNSLNLMSKIVQFTTSFIYVSELKLKKELHSKLCFRPVQRLHISWQCQYPVKIAKHFQTANFKGAFITHLYL